MKIFDKNTIENFAKPMESDLIQKAFESLSFILLNAIKNIQKKNAYINQEVEILPVNQFYSGAVTPNSTLDVLLVITSPQLELNTQKIIKNKLRSFWQRLKFSWKMNTKSKKKKEKYLNSLKTTPINEKKYDMNAFNKDLLNNICNFITPYSMAILQNGIIVVKGEDVPFKVRILPVINKFGSYNFYIPSGNKYFNIDFKKRFDMLAIMQEKYGEIFKALMQIFDSLYYNIFDTTSNSILIESLIANLPEEAFTRTTIYEDFLFAVNYLANTPKNQLFSITDFNTRLIDEKLIKTSSSELEKFFSEIKKLTR